MRNVSKVLLAACLLVPAATLGQAGEGAPVRLEAREVVRDLCLATRPAGRVAFEGDKVARAEAKREHQSRRKQALAQLYRLKVPAEGFSLGAYDARERKLALGFGQPLRAQYGAVSVAIPSETKALFSLEPDAAAAAVAAQQARSASLELYFLLDDSTGAVCSGSVATDVYLLSGKVVSATLFDGLGAQLARAETPLADAYRDLLGGYSGVPEVKFGEVQANEGLDAARIATLLSTIREPAMRCYEARLDQAPSAAGVVVLGIAVNAQGAVDGVTFIADALGDAGLRECLDAAVKKARFEPVKGLFRVPVELRLVSRK